MLCQLSYSGAAYIVGEADVVSFGHGPADASGNVVVVEHPKDVGDRSQLAIMLALRRAGFELLVPYGENTRYDLVIDDGKTLSRVQCKTGRLRKGAVVWSVCSSYAHLPSPKAKRQDYQSDVDFFAVYCSDIGSVYLVPIGDLRLKRQARLRIDPPRNGQRRFIRYGAQYEIGRVG